MLHYHGIITHRPNQFVSWYITEGGYIVTSGRSQSVEQARREISADISRRARLAEECGYKRVKATVEVAAV